MKEGEKNRYEHWLKDIQLLALKHGLTVEDTIEVIENINEFKDVYKWVEIDTFVREFKRTSWKLP